jgi:putative membrane protein
VLRRIVITWAFNVAALWVAAKLVDGVTYGGDGWVLAGAAFVFSLVNMVVKPVVTVLAIPVIILTLGLGLFLVNLLMLYLTDWLVGPFELRSFGAAVLAAIVVWIVNVALSAAFGDPRDAKS